MQKYIISNYGSLLLQTNPRLAVKNFEIETTIPGTNAKTAIPHKNNIKYLDIHSNLHLARVSVVAYAKWRLSSNVSECKQSGPYELLSTVPLTAAGKRITRCLFDEWKRVREMCPLAHTHVEH